MGTAHSLEGSVAKVRLEIDRFLVPQHQMAPRLGGCLEDMLWAALCCARHPSSLVPEDAQFGHAGPERAYEPAQGEKGRIEGATHVHRVMMIGLTKCHPRCCKLECTKCTACASCG
eukprot:2736600-Amphidinium_carterae.1